MRFFIRYQFKNPILQAAAAANRELAAHKIMKAFLEEAERRYTQAEARPLTDQPV
jgi:ribosome-associated toxin RatA of RatAB toxin-antitoxin module